MLKNNWRKVMISCVLILLPILVGAILWNQLPDSLMTHFGADGNPDGAMKKGVAIVVLPLILLALHLVCLIATVLDKNQQNQNKKALGMVYWIVPAISLFVNGLMYAMALGHTMDVGSWCFVLMGVLFIGMGNYLPKTKQNRTLGIKISWTLQNEENWNKTHRLAGKIWVICGVVTLLAVFLPLAWAVAVSVVAMLAAIIVPYAYSYNIYKAHKKAGIVYANEAKSKKEKIIGWISLGMVTVILAGVAVLMFTGDIRCTYAETELNITADYYEDISLAYADMDSVTYEASAPGAFRIYGFGSPRLCMGIFENDALGQHTRYTYTKCDAVVIIKAGEKTLVLNGKTQGETKEIYERLMEKVS